jgi:hypothetical protein
MHKLQRLFYLQTALHISGITSTLLQENKLTITAAFLQFLKLFCSPEEGCCVARNM